MTAATEPTLKPRQLQVTRLRREEEEESWISGEELYTEGSSDDEATLHHAHSRSPGHHHSHPPPMCPSHLPLNDQSKKEGTSSHNSPETPPSAASEPATQDDPHLTETTRRLSQMGVEEAVALKDAASAADPEQVVEEQEEVMLWRPKRGSIKLPHIELDPPSSLVQQQVSG